MKDETYIKDLEAVIEQKEQYIQELEETNKQLQERINEIIKKQIDGIAKETVNKLRVKCKIPEQYINTLHNNIVISEFAKAFHIDLSEEVKQVHEHQNHLKQLQEEYGTDSKNNI